MPRPCSICVHPDRDGIDALLVANTSIRDIAGQFGVSKSAVERHKAEHVPAGLALASQAEAVARADDLLSQVRHLQDKALGILAKAEKAGDLRTALSAIGQARGNLELLAKLLGELDERPQVNLLLSPDWLSLRSALLAALLPFPGARAAVAGALLTAEMTNAAGG